MSGLPAGRGRSVARSLHAEWTKLRTVPSTAWLLLGIVALTVAAGVATVAGTDTSRCPPDAECIVDTTRLSLTGVWLGQAVVVVLAVLAVTNEYGSRMIHTTLAANPRRVTVLLTRMAVVTGATVTLVDSNVLLDIFTEDPSWLGWSGEALAGARDSGTLVINPIIYAEVSVRFAGIEELDEAIPASDLLREALPYQAGFLAGKAYLRYRRQGGTKRSPIADFYIGAHAAVCGYRLLTRDPTRYRHYFPTLAVISPGG